jgi:hypothetical protein
LHGILIQALHGKLFHLNRVVLPKKGRCNKKEHERESSEAFKITRRTHSAVPGELRLVIVNPYLVDHKLINLLEPRCS